MQRQLTRRQFGQGIIAGAAIMTVGDWRSHVLAQGRPVTGLILGARSGPIPSPDADTGLDSDRPDTDSIMTVPSTPRPVVLEALNLATGQVMPFPSPPIVQQSDEYISGITFVDGQLVAALTPASPATNAARPTRLFLQGPPHTIVSVVGLQRDEELRSIVGSRGGRLLGFVAKQNGTPPFRLVEVDRRTGTVSAKVTFDNQRLRALASCHDGTLYTTGVEQDGTTSLLRLDEQNGTLELLVTLHVSNRGWDNGLHSLLCSPAHQLLAFGALRYQSPKALYSVDVSSGAMTKLSDFDTAAVTLFS